MPRNPIRHIRSSSRSTLLLLLLIIGGPLFSQENRENGDFKLAVGLYNDGMYDLAVEQLKSFISVYAATSQGIEARFYLGSAQMKLKRYEDACVTFQNFALTYTDHGKAPEAWMCVGDAYAALKNRQEAASAYERLKVFHPKSPLVPEALLKASEQYGLLGSRENAKRILRSIIQEYPSGASVLSARVSLSAIYAAEGNTDLAEREALRVSRSDAPAPVKAAGLLTLGKLQSENCLFDDAAASFSSILTAYPATPSAPAAAVELGVIESREGELEAAVRRLRAVADNEHAEDSLRAGALFAIGIAYERRQDFANAQSSFEQLITRFPRISSIERALLAAGRSALRGGNDGDARRFAEKLIALPSSEFRREALVLAAEASVSGGHYADAAGYYSSFIASFPRDPFEPEIMNRLGNLYREKLGEYRSAITIYDEFRQRYPRHESIAEVTCDISLCQEALNDFDGAIATCKELQQRFPAYDGGGDLDARIGLLTSRTGAAHEQTMNELASLLGELLTQQSKAEISFRLGSLYFNTLKDYRSAAVQYGNAIDNGLSKEHFIDAYYYRARSYHLLSEIDSIREKAILYYDAFLKMYPESRWNDDAAYYSFVLTSARERHPPAMEAMKDFLATHPSSTHQRELYLALGDRALGGKDYRGAIEYLSRIVSSAPGSAVRGASYQPGIFAASLLKLEQAYIALHQLDSAALCLARFRQLPRPDANAAEAMADLAEGYRQNQQYDSAVVLLKRLFLEFYYSAPARRSGRGLGETFLASGRYDDGLQYFSDRVARNRVSPFMESDDGSSTYYLATACARKAETERAKEYYMTYLRDGAKGTFSAQAYSALGVIARAAGKTDRASSYFKRAAAGGVADDAQSLLLADELFQTGQYPESAKQYRRLAQSSKDATAQRGYIARAIVAYLRSDNLAEADKLLAVNNAMFEKEPNAKAEFVYEKGIYYFRAEDYVNAKKMFEVTSDKYEETRFGPWGRFYLAKILEVTGKLKDAAKNYDEIIEKYPKSDVLPRVLLSLGNMHFNAERFEEAIRFFRRIMDSVDSTNEVLPFVVNNLIEAYESTKLYDAAIKTVRKYIDTYPNDEHLTDKKIKLGTLFTKAGYYDQAVENFQNIINEGESALEAELRYNIGEAYYYKGDYQQAILEFLKVPYLVTTHGKVDWIATSFYMAGQSYEKLSKFDEAMNMYRQIIDRPGIDATFKAGARKEIDRVKQLTKKGSQ